MTLIFQKIQDYHDKNDRLSFQRLIEEDSIIYRFLNKENKMECTCPTNKEGDLSSYDPKCPTHGLSPYHDIRTVMPIPKAPHNIEEDCTCTLRGISSSCPHHGVGPIAINNSPEFAPRELSQNAIRIEPVKAGHPRFFELLKIMEDVHRRKNSNYAEVKQALSNFYESESFGVPAELGVMTRLSDKWCRTKRLISGVKDVVGESLGDTLIDLANYSLILIIVLEEKFGKFKSLEK